MAFVTVSGEADPNAKNKSLEDLIDTHSFDFVGAAPNSSTTESLTAYSDPVILSDADFTNGTITFNGAFSQQVANGSSISIQLQYDYWASSAANSMARRRAGSLRHYRAAPGSLWIGSTQ
ncbi:hypothetical protein GOB91_20940 [Sinorhizobium meliloti]|uniref:hypothetical protein n=1 Tax=Rhizobium meliloti TaxID=382 RepID=UPI000FDBA635|nr:hypothetical protein [Sinorhizobium meliloti]MDW9438582.1 hypothetical protein [Sinorhizobium meliloti]MDW9477940.1 hypothetical protein [Sinorhizobium meliloti]MDW9547904.1 hypothetical protein [Sinorhizobium meliloti]MDW9620938.1 hypothetical protein [Sinorhizobium meliloti]MDW9724753.1 hypothetical protein [Sinorhizobium meliloti]